MLSLSLSAAAAEPNFRARASTALLGRRPGCAMRRVSKVPGKPAVFMVRASGEGGSEAPPPSVSAPPLESVPAPGNRKKTRKELNREKRSKAAPVQLQQSKKRKAKTVRRKFHK